MKLFAAIAFSLLLAACGGGGGGSSGSSAPPPSNVSTNAFPVAAGYRALTAAGQTVRFNSTGTCNGTFSNIEGPASTSTTFESKPALSSTAVISYNFTNCTPASAVTTETRYFDTNYAPLGFSVLGGNYAVWASPAVIPATVHVGDAGVVGTQNLYTSSAKTTPAGRNDVSYVVEADTTSTAIFNIINKNYNAAGTLQSTEQDRYRMQANGALTAISYDILYSSGTHLILQ